MRRAIQDALAVGYGLSLRPGEYPKLLDERLDEHAPSGNVSIWWRNTHFDAHEVDRFPSGPDDRLT